MKYCNSCGLKVDEEYPKCPHCACTTFYHICPNCTEEYVGTYCPGCGTKYNAIPKTCPNCSSKYFTRACPNCGYNPAVDNNSLQKYRQTKNSPFGNGKYGKNSLTALILSIIGISMFPLCSYIAIYYIAKGRKEGEPRAALNSALVLASFGCIISLVYLGILIGMFVVRIK